ncbi:amidohydrolase [Acetobacter sacchari]|nr:amidohydrolase [Acetobacter sacchari]
MKKTNVRTAIRSVTMPPLLAALVASAHAAAAPSPETAFVNGYVYTVDATGSVAEGVSVRDGKIITVGNNATVRASVGPHAKVIDLHGRMLMPGLVDGHMHPLDGGLLLLFCSLQYRALTEAELVTRVTACRNDPSIPRPGGWLIVNAWFQEAMLPKGTVLTRATLDRIDPVHPIVLHSSFGHSALLNTAALKAAGIDATTKTPEGGEIHHDASGQPTGLLEDSAMDYVVKAEPPPDEAAYLQAAQAALAALRAQGVTSFLDAMAREQDFHAFTAAQKKGVLTARAHLAPLITPTMGPDAKGATDYAIRMRRLYDQGPIVQSPSVTIRNVKLFMDGVISAPALTGIVSEPYRVNKGTAARPDWEPGTSFGPTPYFPPAVLTPLLEELVKAGFDPHMHADGDGAVHIALNAVEQVRSALPGSDFRPALAHDEMVIASDLPRFAQLEAIPVLSFQWEKRAPDTTGATEDALGPIRVAAMEPAYALEKAGARIAYGSDWPVDPLNEWFALKVGVTRENDPEAGAQYRGPLGSQPPLSRASALRAITMNSSYELRQENMTGSIEPGKLADLIVLDRNVMTIPAQEISHTKVLLTMVGGDIVWSTGEVAPVTHGPELRTGGRGSGAL